MSETAKETMQSDQVNILEIDGNKISITGQLLNITKDILQKVSKYKRSGGDCFDTTESEIDNGNSNGCFINLTLPRHVLPAIKKGDIYIAYDDPLSKDVDRVIFTGKENEVGQAIENFYSNGYHYGKDFKFRTKVG